MAARNNIQYTLKDVAEANAPENLQIILHGKVYNVSRYLDNHPGGRDMLMEVAGTDASAEFDFVGHSKSAIKALAEFEVGSLAGYSATPKREARQEIHQLDGPLSSSLLLKNDVKGVLKKGSLVGLYIGVFLLLPSALYYAIGETEPLLRERSSIAVLKPFSLALIAFSAVFVVMLTAIGRRFWLRIFQYRDVFAYPPHYTL